ncbi:MAG: ABC transporter ATP-binding protein [Candidatus Aenigmarchaeota archaeon]|nr:ABC transporter ATP-binding protein [Candidatus Aenigmarchaeota archaeon]
MNVIEVSGLKKAFSSRGKITHALNGVNLKIRGNQVFGLLGPNGAGKTTLIYVLSTLLLPTSGKARVLGYDVADEFQNIRERIGICFSGTQFYYNLTSREILNHYSMLYGMGSSARRNKIQELTKDLKMKSFIDKDFSKLSTGMKQKLAVAKSLLNDPELLFLDEPTAGLDVEVAIELRRYIANLVDMNEMTVILTSHQLYEVEEMCREMAVINRGRIVSHGNIKSIRKNMNFPDMVYFHLNRYDRIDFLQKVTGVIEYNINEEGLFVKIKKGPDTAKEIIRLFEDNGTKIIDMEIRKATLEEVFMRIVGKKIRRGKNV